MSDDVSLLQQENRRLRMLVNVLTDKLIDTTARFAAATDIENAIKALGSSDVQTGNGLSGVGYSHAESSIGATDTRSSHPDFSDGHKGVSFLPGQKPDIGLPSVGYSHPENRIGATDTRSSHPDFSDGHKGVPSLPGQEISNASPGGSSSHAPSDSVVKEVNFPAALDGLRKEMVHCKHSSIVSATRILMHLHKSPDRNSHKTLRGFTGLSEDGMTKHIMALKKRGLIVRTGFQQYALTQKSVGILENAKR